MFWFVTWSAAAAPAESPGFTDGSSATVAQTPARRPPDCDPWECGSNGTASTGLAVPVAPITAVTVPASDWLCRVLPGWFDRCAPAARQCPEGDCGMNGTSASGLS
ncbi:MAG: hypothetical protein ABMB14_38425, partial [Myxococcota bacterium]